MWKLQQVGLCLVRCHTALGRLAYNHSKTDDQGTFQGPICPLLCASALHPSTPANEELAFAVVVRMLSFAAML